MFHTVQVSGSHTFLDSHVKYTYCINYKFDCDSTEVIYLLSCKKCKKFYIGSTTDSFRRRFKNHKSCLNRYGRGQREMPVEHSYVYFLSDGHDSLIDLSEISLIRQSFIILLIEKLIGHIDSIALLLKDLICVILLCIIYHVFTAISLSDFKIASQLNWHQKSQRNNLKSLKTVIPNISV